MKITLIGFTDSYNDQRWLEMVGAWVAQHDPALAWALATREVFDLRGKDGSNFLDDRGEYDVVVLLPTVVPSFTSRRFSSSASRRRLAAVLLLVVVLVLLVMALSPLAVFR